MSDIFAKNDLPFLVEAMDRKIDKGEMRVTAAVTATGDNDKVTGAEGQKMTIPDPVSVQVNGDMNEDEYKKCSMIMAVSQNMIQKTITEAAKTAGIPATEALKNMNAWIQGFVDFPLPFFNFTETQSDKYDKTDFTLNINEKFVEAIVNIKNVLNLKEAVLGALRNAGGDLLNYSHSDRKFNYFGVITGYNLHDISLRVIKFQMDLKKTDVKTLCGGVQKTELHSFYDTYQFAADKEMMIKIQEKMGSALIEYFADKLLAFVKSFYDDQMKKYQEDIAGLLKTP